MRCWYAPRDIDTGDSWAASINKAIRASSILVLIFTDEANKSEQVLREINIAASAGVIIVPLRLAKIDPSDELRYYLSGIHWLDAIDDTLDQAVDNLSAYCAAILEKSTKEKAEQAETAKARKKKRRIIAAACAAVLLAAGALLALFLRPETIVQGYVSPKDETPIVFTSLSKAAPGEYVAFGSYEQDDDTANGKEPITWYVLQREPDSLMLISLYSLDCRPYSNSETGSAWDTCDLRAWLNEDFFHAAFTEREQDRILIQERLPIQNPDYATETGQSTQDAVTLLTVEEALRHNQVVSGDALPTPYAKSAGVEGGYSSDWWLSTPGCSRWRAAYGSSLGKVSSYGELQNTDNNAVRPVIWVKVPHQALALDPEPSAEPAPVDASLAVPESRIITLGRYEQDGDILNGAEPVEWIVLEETDGELMLISKDILDAHEYHAAYEETVDGTDLILALFGMWNEPAAPEATAWSNATIRSWLNDEFFRAAFTEAERAAILPSAVPADQNPRYKTTAGEDTRDRVFLPGASDIKRLFTEETLRAKPTAFAQAEGAKAQEWWLRTPGAAAEQFMTVTAEGKPDDFGEYVETEDGLNYIGVRPMIRYAPSLLATEPAQAAEDTVRENDDGTVFFGRYEQDGDLDNGPEPIQWLVLDKQDGKLLLLSKLLLDSYDFDRIEYYKKVTWEVCSLRKWLNGPFYYAAFTQAEQRRVCLTTLQETERDKAFDAGNDTRNYVFIPDYTTLERYLKTSEERIATPSAYARSVSDTERPLYWRRADGVVSAKGKDGGFSGVDWKCYVRPMLWVEADGGE